MERHGDRMLTNTMRKELVEGLLGIFSDNILQIILYGSVAREDNTSESDVDIAIVIKEDMDDRTREKFIIWSADMDLRYDRVFSIVDIQEKNFEKWGSVLPFYKKWGDSLPFYRNVKKEGIVLWKAA